MLPHQRQYAQAAFRSMVEESVGNEFEKLVHRLMELCHPGYLPIRTYGNIGDLGGDGLCACHRRLYACYAPETFEVSKVRAKFLSDLNSALTQRPGQFETFIFVHNDQRGVHPVVAGLIAETQPDYAEVVALQQMGPRKLWIEALPLDLLETEHLLGHQIPVHDVVYSVGMAEIEPLLRHLADNRPLHAPRVEIALPSTLKADYNRLSSRAQHELQEARPYVYQIGEYYQGLLNHTEQDEVAEGFTQYYRCMREEYGDQPDEILWQMQRYVLGQAGARWDRADAANVVVAFFFDQCDIFEIPPPGWQENEPAAGAS
ncbi:ABC-three component system protein [Spirillospora sp. CA-294931]|uniref:ABC-three component system protein n=1 Tax=Spirillospora sp. CA-294931 TaxID=3240042 RepID=UPI003D9474BC